MKYRISKIKFKPRCCLNKGILILYTGNYRVTLINRGIHMVTDVFVGNNFNLNTTYSIFCSITPLPQHHQERIILQLMLTFKKKIHCWYHIYFINYNSFLWQKQRQRRGVLFCLFSFMYACVYVCVSVFTVRNKDFRLYVYVCVYVYVPGYVQ